MTHNSDSRMIRRLAGALCASYSIPSGDNLVVILGDGDEANNQVAVESWVRHALLTLDETSARDMLPHLVRRLREQLAPWELMTW
jgi:hypothetical protein